MRGVGSTGRSDIRIHRLIGLVAVVALGACAGERTHDPFTATGELVALSGGDAGSRRACIVCHGLDGQGDGELAPRLAGLPMGYLLKQLEDYADGRRSHEEMRTIAKALNARERREVAAYFARLPVRGAPAPEPVSTGGEIAALYHRGDPSRGLPACAACHGAAGQGIGPANPPLAGQPHGYLDAQLKAWRDSKRRNDPGDVMLEISQRLTSAESAALSAYAAALAPATGAAAATPAASP